MTKRFEITVGDTDFNFEVSNADYNKFINNSASNPVQAGFNLLTGTVDQKQRAKLIGLIADEEKKPHGTLVMELVAAVSEEMTNDLPTVVKKRKPTQEPADETDLTA